jgi:hypothetical protein
VHWIPVISWLAAAMVAAVILGFCAYEIGWKARRLQRDLERLQGLGESLQQLQGDVAAAQRRLASTGVR